MYQVFNMGHRMELYVPETIAENIIQISKEFNIDAQVIGYCKKSSKKKVTIIPNTEVFLINLIYQSSPYSLLKFLTLRNSDITIVNRIYLLSKSFNHTSPAATPYPHPLSHKNTPQPLNQQHLKHNGGLDVIFFFYQLAVKVSESDVIYNRMFLPNMQNIFCWIRRDCEYFTMRIFLYLHCITIFLNFLNAVAALGIICNNNIIW